MSFQTFRASRQFVEDFEQFEIDGITIPSNGPGYIYCDGAFYIDAIIDEQGRVDDQYSVTIGRSETIFDNLIEAEVYLWNEWAAEMEDQSPVMRDDFVVPNQVRQFIERKRDDIADFHWNDVDPTDHGYSVPVAAFLDENDCEDPGWYTGNLQVELDDATNEVVDYWCGDWDRVADEDQARFAG